MRHYLIDACESIDAAFFSGDDLHDPETLAEMERYIARWTRQGETIKKHNFFAEEGDPAPMQKYNAAVAAP